MGYSTDFDGQFDLSHPLKSEHKAYLEAFSRTRRMKRDAAKTVILPDPIRAAVGLPVGEEGEYYVGSSGDNFGQVPSPDITAYNEPPTTQPGLWCQWTPNEDGTAIEWDQGEKFYGYVTWLEYLIANFLAPWGYVLTGEVTWVGQEDDDRGKIVVKDSQVTTKMARIVYE